MSQRSARVSGSASGGRPIKQSHQRSARAALNRLLGGSSGVLEPCPLVARLGKALQVRRVVNLGCTVLVSCLVTRPPRGVDARRGACAVCAVCGVSCDSFFSFFVERRRKIETTVSTHVSHRSQDTVHRTSDNLGWVGCQTRGQRLPHRSIPIDRRRAHRSPYYYPLHRPSHRCFVPASGVATRVRAYAARHRIRESRRRPGPDRGGSKVVDFETV